MAGLTYGHFFQTGVQDCGNAFSPSDFELDVDKTAEQIVDAEMATWDSAEWIGQQDFEDLDPSIAYETWKRGWRSCAVRAVQEAIDERRQQALDDLELFYLYSDDELIERYDNLQEALDVLARLPSGDIKHGDGNGPDYTMFATDPASDELAVISAETKLPLAAMRKKFDKDRKAARERGYARNPAIDQDDVDAAQAKYVEFHRYDPRRLEELGNLEIPARVRKLGAAKHVLYRSAKVDPSTLRKPKRPVSYIHEHDAGVNAYATDGELDTDVPREFTSVTALVKLGKCLGFALRDGTEAEGTNPLPDLACTPDGKCLLVIQDKRQVLAMMWGGALGVFARGIDG